MSEHFKKILNMSKFNGTTDYHKGLDRQLEAVISDHYIYKLMCSQSSNLYNQDLFMDKALYIDQSFLTEQIIPSIFSASEKFITNRVEAAVNRAHSNFLQYGRSNSHEVTAADVIAEAMFDRQFLKAPKSNYNRVQLSNEIRTIIDKKEVITLIIVALPFKSESPLKCRGEKPDLAEIDFLLNLYELIQVVARLYQRMCTIELDIYAKIIIVSDGLRFNQIVNYPLKKLKMYQSYLKKWIKKLNIDAYVELVDYQTLLLKHLPQTIINQKQEIKAQAVSFYKQIMGAFSDYKSIQEALNYGIKNDPEPELSHTEGRFIPLFKSLLFSMKYKSISEYCQKRQLDYNDIYLPIISYIFKTSTELDDKDLEELRLKILEEAWNATIDYISEIKSDRDLENDPILTCIPGAIRWTIHAKPGQLGLLIPTAHGDPVLPWHGISLFLLSKKNKLKQYNLPVIAVENMNAIPVLITNDPSNQPIFYIDSFIANEFQLRSLLNNNLSRAKKS